jgi:hypothetical protein
MPFTVSHVAAAWPFEKSRLVLSAVLIGAMVPDFEYFIHLRMTGRWSHTLAGALEFCLPAALIVLALFHGVVKRAVVLLLPSGVQRRIVMKEFRFRPISRFLLIALSAFVGIASHLIWDSLTHPGGWVVEHLSWFRDTNMVWGHRITNYKLAQHGSTILGLVLLGLWFWNWYHKSPERNEVRPVFGARTRIGVAIAMIAVAAIVGVVRARAMGLNPHNVLFAVNGMVTFISVTLMELLVFSLAMRWRADGVPGDRAIT